MGDDGEPAVFVLGLAGVVFLDPVRLDDDAVARLDEVSGQFKRIDRVQDLLAQCGNVVVGGFATEDGDLGRAERGRGERVHEEAAI
jgi:hypothetical protein